MEAPAESAGADELRPFQASSVTPVVRPDEILRHGDHQSAEAHGEGAPDRRPEEVRQRLVAIDPVPQEGVEPPVRIRRDLPDEPTIAGAPRGLGQRERRLVAVVRRRRDLVVERQAGSRRRDDLQEPVAPGLEDPELAHHRGADVRPEIEPLERRPAPPVLIGQTGRADHDRQRHRRLHPDRPGVRPPAGRLGATPRGRAHDGFLPAVTRRSSALRPFSSSARSMSRFIASALGSSPDTTAKCRLRTMVRKAEHFAEEDLVGRPRR